MQKDLLKNDFYEYVNKKWISKSKIPAFLGSLSSYSELYLHIEKELRKLVADWASGKQEIPADPQIYQMVQLYKMFKNTKMQEKQGWKPVLNQLELIEELTSFKELDSRYLEFNEFASFLPYSFEVGEDFINNKVYTLWFNGLGSLLPSKEYYSNAKGKKILAVLKKVALKYYVDLGKTKAEAKRMIDSAVEYDNYLSQFLLSSVEKNQIEKLYNPYSAKDLQSFSHRFGFVKHAEALVKQEIEQIIVPNKKFLENIEEILSEEHFKGFKNLMYLHEVLSAGSYLSPSTRKEYFELNKVLSGATKQSPISRWAYNQTLGYFSEPFSLYYGKSHFSDEARKDVLRMIQKIINIYKERLTVNEWLSKDTIKKAIIKLEKIVPMVGYPDYIYPYYAKFIVTPYKDGGSLTSNMNHFDKISEEFSFSLYKKEVDPNIWGMSSYEVNAYFNPLANRIVFPAGYLQAPFYSLDQNSSANYGGLGMTIAHEISHAFDNNGAQFDEFGSFNNWWTEDDYKAFKEKTQLMIDWFDGFETQFGKINGSLTVSENIADQGGILVALEAAKTEPDYNPEAFFENYAYCEREKSREEVALRRLLTDPHSPAKERVNLQLKICKEFQEHYKLEPKDKMFAEAEKIFKIW
ncbi:M13 family metallopeptidase [Mycoplasma hafezii]|uniref:M13 family metallopeptidase n=1 Tax=Mycoplasma hafezii TaxID=525886 RepID=UPI003CF2FEE5